MSNSWFLKKYFKKGDLIYNVWTLMAGNVLAQLVTILLAPVITRLYLPEHVGVIAAIMSFVYVLSVISCMRYEMAVVLPKSDEKAQNLIVICLALSFIVSLISLIIVPLVNEWVESFFQVKGITIFLYLVPLGVFANGLEKTYRFWFTRKKNFALIAKTRMIIPISTNGIKIAAGFLVGSSALWLIIGDIIGIFIVAAILAIAFLQNNYQQFKNSITRRDIRAVAREYEKFPKYNSIAAVMNALSENLPIFLFGFYFSFELVGYYALARNVLKKPVQLVSNSVRGVFLQRVADITNKGKSIRSDFIKTTIGLAAAGIIPFSIITIAGEWIFFMVFGAKWATAGFYAKFLSPWLFSLFIIPPATQVILVEQKLIYLLIYEFLLLLFSAIAIISGYYISSDPWVAVALFSGVGITANFILILYAYVRTSNYKSPVAEYIK